MAVTLRQIADELNISPTLVSRVLNDNSRVWASKATRARILEAAERLNYRPSMAARALATGRSMLLAVSAADADWQRSSSGRVAEMTGLINAAAEMQYRVLVMPSSSSRAHIHEFERMVSAKGCDGFCVYAEQAGPELYEYLRSASMPFVVIGNPGPIEVPRVDHNNEALILDSVRWLSEEGRRRIAITDPISVSLRPGGNEAASQTDLPPFVRIQSQAYKTAVIQYCGEFDEKLTTSHLWDDLQMVSWLKEQKPDALITRGLAATLQWKFCLQSAGFKVPEDVLIMAQIDGSELNYLLQSGLHRSLACHVHDPHAVGRAAGELLLRSIQQKRVPHETVFVTAAPPRWC